MIFYGLKFHGPGRPPAGVDAAQLAPGPGLTPGVLVACSILSSPLGGRPLVCTLYGQKGATKPSRRTEGWGLGQPTHSVLATQDSLSSA